VYDKGHRYSSRLETFRNIRIAFKSETRYLEMFRFFR
jgi:hypothetical protein